MKTAILLLCLPFSYCVQAQYSEQDFYKLHALKGNWVMKAKNSIILETWRIENDSTMAGASYTIKGVDTALQETVTLAIRDGVITYTPVTKYQNDEQPVVFTLQKIAEGNYIFTNPAHDFPQEIHYELVDENRLVASISGPAGGKNKVISYAYDRQKK